MAGDLAQHVLEKADICLAGAIEIDGHRNFAFTCLTNDGRYARVVF